MFLSQSFMACRSLTDNWPATLRICFTVFDYAIDSPQTCNRQLDSRGEFSSPCTTRNARPYRVLPPVSEKFTVPWLSTNASHLHRYSALEQRRVLRAIDFWPGSFPAPSFVSAHELKESTNGDQLPREKVAGKLRQPQELQTVSEYLRNLT